MKTSRKTEYVIQRYAKASRRWKDYSQSLSKREYLPLLRYLRLKAIENESEARYRAVGREVVDTILGD